MMNTLREWVDEGHPISEDDLIFIEKRFEVIFPLQYRSLILLHSGGTPQKDTFEYYDESALRMAESGIGYFIPLIGENTQSVKSLKEFPPEFFPEGLIAFGETGGGDFMCFDYRQGKDNLDPPIVYWNHGAEIGKDVSFIAPNFDKFISLLKQPDD